MICSESPEHELTWCVGHHDVWLIKLKRLETSTVGQQRAVFLSLGKCIVWQISVRPQSVEEFPFRIHGEERYSFLETGASACLL